MTALTFDRILTLKIGDRVAFPDGADCFPNFMFDDRLTGTVCHVERGLTCVLLDQHKAELDDWDNQLQLDTWEEDTAITHGVERLLNADDGSLDSFVQQYCTARDLPIDGDVFGVVFNGIQTEWTEDEAAAIIEDGARIYGLRTGQDWNVRTLDDLPAALRSAWNRYAFEGSTDALNDIAKLIELGERLATPSRV